MPQKPKARSIGTMAATRTAAVSGHDGVDPDHWIALKSIAVCVLGCLAGALAPAAGVFGTVGSSRRRASSNLGGIGMAENVGGGSGVSACLGLSCRTLEHNGGVVVRVGDGRPVRFASCDYPLIYFK